MDKSSTGKRGTRPPIHVDARGAPSQSRWIRAFPLGAGGTVLNFQMMKWSLTQRTYLPVFPLESGRRSPDFYAGHSDSRNPRRELLYPTDIRLKYLPLGLFNCRKVSRRRFKKLRTIISINSASYNHPNPVVKQSWDQAEVPTLCVPGNTCSGR